jgi:hypothetical protein
MPLVMTLPAGLEDAKGLLRRQKRASERKQHWESIYRDAYRYTMPERETFDDRSPGQRMNRHVYDSTGLEAVHKTANRMQALLAPPWRQWCQLEPGSEVDPEAAEAPEILAQLQEQTNILFDHLNHSNFSTVINEAFLDIMVGTASLTVELESGNLVFDAVPLSQIELEEGPRGSVETVWRPMTVPGAHLERMFPGIELSENLRKRIEKRPEQPQSVVYGVVFEPKSGRYYAVVLEKNPARIAWRWNYEGAGPFIVARATVVPGEIYGRGPILWALPDLKTLNAMVEFMLRHAAIQIAPPLTAVSDGILNPYNIRLQPNTVIPVSSNDNAGPSLRALEIGGNFQIGDIMVNDLRSRIRRMLLDDDRRAEGPVRTATEISIEDRELIQQWGSVFGRVQSELLAKVVDRSVALLSSIGKMARLQIDGKQLTLKYVSPLSRAQDEDDLLALDAALQRSAALGEAVLAQGYKIEDIPAWIARKTGMDQDLVRSEEERRAIQQAAAQAAQAEGGMQ